MTIIEPSGQLRLEMPCEWICTHADDLERDRWGRPVIDGKPRTRVSTLASTLDGGYGLIAWKARMTLLGATQATLREAVAHREDKKHLDGLVEDATTRAGAGDAATQGTLMHEVLTRYALDLDEFAWDDLDEQQVDMVVQFGAALRGAGLTAVHAEQFVVGAEWAGTYDLGLVDRDGRHYLADIKTSAAAWDARYPLKVATQLAAYADARRYCPVNGYLPTPGWAGLLLITVPLNKGAADIYRIDSGAASRLLDLARTVRAERSGQRALAVRL